MKQPSPRYRPCASLFNANSVAVVGMACRFSGVENYQEFWQRLIDGREMLRRFTPDEIRASGESREKYSDPHYVATRGQIERGTGFDARFFGISAQEAAILDPQQRMFLEEAWHALEDAGVVPGRRSLRVGVYAGAAFNTYLLTLTTGRVTDFEAIDPWQVGIGNDKDTLTSRVAYKLNLSGPAITVQTACSTSLAAIHLGARALLNFDCDLSLCGGTSVRFPQDRGYLYRPEGIESPDGRCRPFALGANGTVFGDGVGVVVLKRLEDAIEQGDRIYAVLRGSAINNDASLKAGFTAPSMQGQKAVIQEALLSSGVLPHDIDYIEAHGTGTPVGDAIEFQALCAAFEEAEGRPKPCRVGSVKGNIGHTDNAAGVAGFIKTALALYHETLPATLHCVQAESQFARGDSAFVLCDRTEHWPRAQRPRMAGVSSFGVGGTNVHTILQEAPLETSVDVEEKRTYCIPLSARSAKALAEQVCRLEQHMQTHPKLRACDIAHSYQMARQPMEWRDYRLSSHTAQGNTLSKGESGETAAQVAMPNPTMGWLFPGQGSQYVGMGKALYANTPRFRDTVETCLSHLPPSERETYRDLLTGDSRDVGACSLLNDTRYTHLALFIFQYSVASLYESLGLKADLLLGHSLGEIAAATFAGVFGLEDAVRVLRARGTLISLTPRACLYAIDSDLPLSADDLPDQVTISCWNGPRQYVLAGPDVILERFVAAAGPTLRAKRLSADRGFHSPLMDGATGAFLEVLRTVRLREPRIPMVSSVTGSMLDTAAARDPEYWARQMRLPVQFYAAAATLLAKSPQILLELGPGRQLVGLIRLHGPPSSCIGIAGLSAEEASSDDRWLRPIASVWVHGAHIEWDALSPVAARRVEIPCYPFQRDLYEIPVRRSESPPRAETAFVYRRTWSLDFRRSIGRSELRGARCVVIGEGSSLRVLADLIRARGAEVRVFEHSCSASAALTEPHHRFDFKNASSWHSRFARLREENFTPQHVYYVACAGELTHAASVQWPLYMVQSLSQQLGDSIDRSTSRTTVHWLASSVFAVLQTESLFPLNSRLWGIARVLPQEHPRISSHFYDLQAVSDNESRFVQCLNALEVATDAETFKVRALRDGAIWTPGFQQISGAELKCSHTGPPVLRSGATYLVTGGAGGIGRAVTKFLVDRMGAKVIACGRTPRRELRGWDEHTKALQQVSYIVADVVDRAALEDLRQRSSSEGIEISGIFHCAGVAGEGLMRGKTEIEGRQVHDAKVLGALNLCDVFGDVPLDFMVFFGSVNGWFGGLGQSDYSAANMFLEALAHTSLPWRTVCIAWDTWLATGMAAHADSVRQHAVFSHKNPNAARSLTIDFPPGHWLQDEHRIDGMACLPATAYVSLLADDLGPNRSGSAGEFALSELHFIRPFFFHGVARSLTLSLERLPDRTLVSAFATEDTRSRTFSAEVRASVGRMLRELASALPPEFRGNGLPVPRPSLSARLQLGGRWNCVERTERMGLERYRTVLRQPSVLLGDLPYWPYHPALMDAALIALQPDGGELQIPVSISDVVIFRPLHTARFSCAEITVSQHERTSANVWITDGDLQVLMFLREVTFIAAGSLRKADGTETRTAAREAAWPSAAGVGGLALKPIAALEGLDLILGGLNLDNVIVTARPIEEMQAVANDPLRHSYGIDVSSELTPVEKRLSSAGGSPGEILEAILARVLGLESVAWDDNFFELGGDSLIGLKVVSEARKAALQVTLAMLYRAKSVNGLLAEIKASDAAPPAHSMPSSKLFGLLDPTDVPKMPVDAVDAYPLSQLQQGILYYKERFPDTDLYKDFLWARIAGTCEARVLEDALAACVERHPVLRTIIETTGYSEPLNVVYEKAVSEITRLEVKTELDVRAWAANAKRTWSERVQGVRFAVLQGSEDFWVVMLVDDALIDGWSTTSLLAELLARYDAKLDGRVLAYPPLCASFHDFVRHERDAMRDATQAAFWRRQLEDAQVFSVCSDEERSEVEGAAPQITIEAFGGVAANVVHAVAARHGAAPKSVLLAAYLLTLSAWRRSREVIVGVETHARLEVADGDAVLGLHLNMLPMRKVFRPETLQQFIDGVVAVEGTLLEYRHYPLSAIQRNYSYPLFDACFNYTHFHVFDAQGFQRIKLLQHYGEEKTHYPFKLWINRDTLRGERFDAYVAYDRARLTSAGVHEFFSIFSRVLQGFLEDPSRSTTDLRGLGKQRRPSSMISPAFRTEQSLPEVFAKICRNRGTKPAIFDGATVMNFATLYARSNQLAHHLSIGGVGLGDRVAVLLPRSADWVVALFALMKLGATFVALDAWRSAAQVRQLIDAAEPAMLISTRAMMDAHDLIAAPLRAVLIDAEEHVIASRSGDQAEKHVSARNTAYIVFTSGSTGGPKGVSATHGGLLNRCVWQWSAFPFRDGDVGLLKTPSAFVDSIWELFGPLCAGQPVVVVADCDMQDPARWSELIEAHQVTHLIVVPSLLTEIIAAVGKSAERSTSSLRQITVSGELLRWNVWSAAAAALPSATWINLYGSAEVAADVACFVMEAGAPAARVDLEASVPVGRPISDTALYILDDDLELTDEGATGELHVAGAGLCNGYFRRPGLTAEKFIPNPWSLSSEHSRLYRTGDLARIVDGQLVILGRCDRDVKVRGVRVNLDNVELRLRAIPGIVEAATALSNGAICAYVRVESGTSEKSLWHQIRLTLSAAERPSRLYRVMSLPRTPGGKIDRRRMVDNAVPVASDSGRAPSSDVERCLVRLWATLFPGAKIFADSHFEELGGNSLLLVRLAALMEQAFGYRPRIHDLSSALLLDQQALLLKGRVPLAAAPLVGVIVDEASAHLPFPLTPMQEAYWVARQASTNRVGATSHFYNEFEIENLDLARLRTAWKRLVERHSMLRAIVRPDGLQQVLSTQDYVIDEYDLSTVLPQQRATLLDANRRALSHEVFAPDQWPLFSLRAIRVEASRWLLCISIDFLLVDAWSLQILDRELATLYRDPQSQLPALSVTFRDIQAALAARRESRAYSEAREYWLRRAATLSLAPILPINRLASEFDRVGRRQVSLSLDQTRALTATAERQGVSLTGLLLAVYAAVLQRWSESKTFSLVVTLLDRPPIHPQIDLVVGDFTSALPLEITALARDGFTEFAQRTEMQFRQDLDHRDFGAVALARAMRAQGREPPAPSFVFTRLVHAAVEPESGLDSLGREIYRVTQTPDVLIDVQAVTTPQGMRLQWDARDHAFPGGMVEDMFAAFEGAIDELQRNVRFTLVEDGDQSTRQILNALKIPPQPRADGYQSPFDLDYMQRIWETATRDPQRPAILSAERCLTYGELWQRATALHGVLCAIVPPPTMVGIHIPVGVEQVIALLATQMGNFCYVPLSCHWPELRVLEIVDAVSIGCVLTVPGSSIDFSSKCIVVPVTDAPLPSQAPLAAPSVVSGSHLAYVMFTSGSTGKPKGVMMRRSAVGNTLADLVQRLTLDSADRVWALSEISFDLSVFDVFGSLMAGAAIVMPQPSNLRDPKAWWHLCSRFGVTVWNSVPAYMELLVDYAKGKSGLPALPLRWILLSGDWIALRLPPLIQHLFVGARLLSLGGATEAGIWSVCFEVGAVDPAWRSIPYGTPLRDQGCRILDVCGDDCPVGVAGELCITGQSLSDGYFGQPELTERAFCRHPLDGQRMYRTGDMARYRRDGVIELLGRTDTQVKVAGNRIECGEIEQVILGVSGVQKAIVVALRERENGELQLHAVVVMSSACSLEQLQSYCRDRLPISMVPAQWHTDVEIPLSSNGKVDRKSLARILTTRNFRDQTQIERPVRGM